MKGFNLNNHGYNPWIIQSINTNPEWGSTLNIYILNPIQGSQSYFLLSTGFTDGYSHLSPSDLINKAIEIQ